MLGVGDRAPDFTLKRMDGAEISLQDLAASKPVLVTFFKVSCPTCQLALPFIERLSKGPNITVVAISQDDPDSSRQFRSAYGLTLPTLLDERKNGYPVSNAFGITHVPALFVIEPGGEISMAVGGFSKKDIVTVGERAGIAPFREHESVPEWKAG